MFWFGADWEVDLTAKFRGEVVSILTDDYGVTDPIVLVGPVNNTSIPSSGTWAQFVVTQDQQPRVDSEQLVELLVEPEGGGDPIPTTFLRRVGYRTCTIQLEIYRSDSPKWSNWIQEGFTSGSPTNLIRRDAAGLIAVQGWTATATDALSPSGDAWEKRRRITCSVTIGVKVETELNSIATVQASTTVAGMPLTAGVPLE